MEFSETFLYSLDTLNPSDSSHCVLFSVWDRFQGKTFRGMVHVPLLAMIQHRQIDKWFEMEEP